MRQAQAFTMLEVLAILLVVGIGLTSAVGVFAYAMRMSGEAQARSLAMATAISVAYDRSPLLDPDLAPDWTATTYDFNAATGTGVSKGPINGMYAVRTETTVAADISAQDGAVVHQRSVRVDVDIFETGGGKPVASFTTRLVRQRGGP
jgi:Tfp pilus assembly protein PilV